MRTLVIAAVAAASLMSLAPAAQARPHKVCTFHHHHRMCHFVRR